MPAEPILERRSAERDSAPRSNPFAKQNSDAPVPPVRNVFAEQVNVFAPPPAVPVFTPPPAAPLSTTTARSGSDLLAELLRVRESESGLKLTALKFLKLHKILYPGASDEERVAALKKYHQ